MYALIAAWVLQDRQQKITIFCCLNSLKIEKKKMVWPTKLKNNLFALKAKCEYRSQHDAAHNKREGGLMIGHCNIWILQANTHTCN